MHNTLFVVDEDSPLLLPASNAISFEQYLREYPKINEPKIRLINLCDTERYLSQGYYCSLLAEARGHEVLPSIKSINALRSGGASIWLNKTVLGKLKANELGDTNQLVCMGKIADQRLAKVASKVFQAYAAPLLTITIQVEATGVRVNIQRCQIADLAAEGLAFCQQVFADGARKQWRKSGVEKKHRWEMALLVNPQEAVPPSNKSAINRFVKAGDKLGIRLHVVTANELTDINQYDALFIRETTAIDHHTYRLASLAEQQGLMVMDDPDSILRCCNKVFLHDAFNYRKVPSLKTQVVSRDDPQTLEELENAFAYPMVLKMPEGSFSKGVFKVANREQLKQVLGDLLKESALVLAQEYIFTEFDWRIGVLNGRALYACRYYMARNHWQIYNHGSKRFFSGGFDALPTFEVPRKVLNAAMKAAAIVGDGLYGIDIKEVDGHAYVLEVNDNPSIDHGVEDHYLGDELYMQIMAEFLRRLEQRGR